MYYIINSFSRALFWKVGKFPRVLLFIFFPLFFVACAPSGGGGGGTAAAGTSPGDTSGDTSGDTTSPIVVTLQSTEVTANEGEPLTFTIELGDSSSVGFIWAVQYDGLEQDGLLNGIASALDLTGDTVGLGFLSKATDTTTATIEIKTIDDDLYEGASERFRFVVNAVARDFELTTSDLVGFEALSSEQKAGLLQVASSDLVVLVAIGKIEENGETEPKITLTQDSRDTTGEGSSQTFNLTLDAVSGINVTYTWNISATASTTDNDIEIADFVETITLDAASAVVTIPAGQISDSIVLTPKADRLYEGTENFVLNIVEIVGATPDNLTANGEIMDSDRKPTLEVQPAIAEHGNNLDFLVIIGTPVAGGVSFEYYLDESTNDTTSVSIAEAADSIIISIPTGERDDTTNDEYSTILHITDIVGTTNTTADILGTITDHNFSTTDVIYFGNTFVQVTEGAGFEFTVNSNATSDATFDWTITGNGVVGAEDFEDATGSAIINNGTVTVTVDTKEDTIYESFEEFTITLNSAIPIANPNTFTIIVIDNDPIPTLSFNPTSVEVTEASSAIFRLELSGASGQSVTADWRIDYDSAGVSDFKNSITGTVVFASGVITKDITIEINDDDIYEIDETFQVRIVSIAGANFGADVAIGTIKDNEKLPVLSISADSSADEGGTLTFTITSNRLSSQLITFIWSALLPTATTDDLDVDFRDFLTSNGDGRLVDTTSTIVDIQIVKDNIYEGTETLNFALVSVTGATNSDSKVVTIEDNETAPSLEFDRIAPNGDDLEKEEGASYPFIVSVTGDAAGGRQRSIEFDWAVLAGTATSDDFNTPSGSAAIASGANSVPINITTKQDDSFEGVETFGLKITAIRRANNNNLPVITDINRKIRDDGDNPNAVLTFRSRTATINEDGGTAAVEIFGSDTSTEAISFTWTIDFGTATIEDFSDTTGTATIAVGDTSVDFSVGIVNDRVFEGPETFTLVISNPTSPAVFGLIPSQVLTIQDSNPAPELSISAIIATVTEASSITFQAILDSTSANDVSFTWTISGGESNPTVTADFKSISGEVTISKEKTTENFTIAIEDDTINEADVENFTLTISNIVGADSGSPTSVNASITDNDENPVIGIRDAVADEGNIGESNPVAFELYFTGNTQSNYQEITVNWDFVQQTAADINSGTAAFDVDYRLNPDNSSKQVTIPAFTTSATFNNIETIGDVTAEPNETFVVELENPINATLADDSTAIGTIKDDEGIRGVLSIIGSVGESTTDISIQFTPENPAPRDTTLIWEVVFGDNAIGQASTEDFTSSFTTTGDFAIYSEGSSDVTTSDILTIANDTIYEAGNEIFTIQLRDVLADRIVASVEANIVDNDALPALTISSKDIIEGNGGSIGQTLEVSFVGPTTASAQDVAFDWIATAGTATLTDDYFANPTRVTIPAGNNSRNIDFATRGDVLVEGPENFIITLSNPSGATLSDSSTATITILEDDGIEAGNLVVVDEIIEGGQLAISFTPAYALPQATTLSWEIVFADPAAIGQAEAADISGVTSGNFPEISGGSTPTALSATIDIANDNIYEGSETFTLLIKEADRTITSDAVSITDNDGEPVLAITPSREVTEGRNGANFTELFEVRFIGNAPSVHDVVFTWSATPGTATEAEDYNIISENSLTIPAGDTSTNIEIQIVHDTAVEGAEDFIITLSNPSNAELSTTSSTATITILENDGISGTLANITPNPVDEGGSIVFSFTPTFPFPETTTLNWEIDFGTAAAADFSGDTTGDFSVTAGTNTPLSATINILDDTIDEVVAETFTIRIIGAGSQIARSDAVSITDGDNPPMLAIASSKDIIEGDADASGVVSRPEVLEVSFVGPTTQSAQDVSFDWSTTPGTATEADYIANLVRLTIPAGESSINIPFSIIGDDLVEGPENFIITLLSTNLSGADLSATSRAATITIIEDDGILGTLIVDSSVDEGNNITISFTPDYALPQDTTLSWEIDFGSSTASAADFSGAITGNFPVIKDTTTTLRATINTTEDTIHEGAETFTILIKDEAGSQIARSSEVSITDNDNQPMLTIASSKDIIEGNTNAAGELVGRSQVLEVSFVDITTTSAQDVSFIWSTTPGTATPEDYTGSGGSLTIPAGDTSIDIPFNIIGDDLVEGPENFIITLSNPSNAGLSAATIATITILEDDGIDSGTLADIPNLVAEDGSIVISFRPAYSIPQDTILSWEIDFGTASAADFSSATTGNFSVTADTRPTLSATINIENDTIHEADAETFTIHIIEGDREIERSGEISITDNDAPPILTIASSKEIIEGDADAAGDGVARPQVLKVSFTGTTTHSAQAVSFDWSTTPGTATAADYSAVSSRSETIPAGDTSIDILFSIIGDDLVEGPENFIITLSNPSAGVTISDASTATITIIEDDGIIGTLADITPGTEGGNIAISFLPDYSLPQKDATLSWEIIFADPAAIGLASAADINGAISGNFSPITAGLDPVVALTATISIEDDKIYEAGDETFTLLIKEGTREITSSDVTITENDIVPVITLTPLIIEETDGRLEQPFTVAISKLPSSRSAFTSVNPITFTWEANTGTAGASDFIGQSATMETIPADATSTTFTISILGDNIAEAPESFQIILESLVGATTDNNTYNITLNDDDQAATLSIASPTDGNIAESLTAALTLTFKAGDVPDADVTYYWATSTVDTDSIEAGDVVASGNFIFAAGATSQSFSGIIVEDTIFEAAQIFNIKVTTAPDGSGDTIDNRNFTINDDDAPVISITAADGGTSKPEGEAFSYNISLHNSDSAEILGLERSFDFDWAVRVGTDNPVTPATDFDATNATGTVSVSSDNFNALSFDVQPIDDSIYENDEEFIVEITFISVGSISSNSRVAGTIRDNDEPTISITTPILGSVEEGAEISVGVTLTKTDGGDPITGLEREVGFTWTVTAGNTNPVTPSTDFDSPTAAVIFDAADGGNYTFTIETTNDSIYEDDETFTVTLTGSALLASGAASVATGTITDITDTPLISIARVRASVLEGAPFPVIVTLTNGDNQQITGLEKEVGFTWALTGSGTLPVTPANPATDFDRLTAAVTFDAADGGNYTFTINTATDSIYENTEGFTIMLSIPTGRAALADVAADITVNGTITDDDTPTISIAGGIQTGLEGEGISFPITLTNGGNPITGLEREISFIWTVSPGADPAASVGDFNDTTSTVILSALTPDIENYNVVVTTSSDSIYEDDEIFIITLSDETGGASLAAGTAIIGNGVITDNDTPVISITAAEPTSRLEGRAFTYNISLRNNGGTAISGVEKEFKFTWTVVGTGGNPAVFADFRDSTSDTPTIRKGTPIIGGYTFTIPTNNDRIYEYDEGFIVRISSISPTTIGTATAEGTITDNDAPVISITSASTLIEVDEGASFLVGVTLEDASSNPITALERAVGFTWTVDTGFFNSVTPADDFSIDTETINILAGADIVDYEFNVTTINDTIFEQTERFRVILSNATPTGVGGASLAAAADITVTGTITDNDFPVTSELELTTTDITEGDIISVGVTLRNASTDRITGAEGRQLSFGWTVTAGVTNPVSVDRGVDFVRVRGSNPSTPFGINYTFDILTNDDAIYENDEEFEVAVRFDLIAIANSSTTGTIKDNDEPVISIARASATVDEGDSFPVSVTFRNGDNQQITGLDRDIDFTWAVSGRGTRPVFPATPLTDFSIDTGDINIPAGANISDYTFNVITASDTIFESNAEGFTITLSRPSDGVLFSDNSVTGDIIEDDAPVSSTLELPNTITEGASFPVEVTLINLAGDEITAVENRTIFYNWTVDAGDNNPVTPAADFVDLAMNGGSIFADGVVVDITSLTFDLTTDNDAIFENDEEFKVTVVVNYSAERDAAEVTFNSDVVTGTIIDNDAPTISRLKLEPALVTEGNTISVGIALGNTSGDITILERELGFTWTVVGIGENSVDSADFDPASGTGTIPIGDISGYTFDITTDNDAIFENDEAFEVTVNIDDIGIPSSATGIIIDNDAPITLTSTLRLINTDMAEGSDIVVGIALQNTVIGEIPTFDQNIGFTWTLVGIGGDPVDSADFADATIGTGTIPRRTDISDYRLTITTINDAIFENDENFRVTVVFDDLSINGSYVNGTITDTISIISTLSLTTTDIAEGRDIEVEIALKYASDDAIATSAQGIGFTWTVIGNGNYPVALADFDTTTGTGTIPTGNSDYSFPITTNNDAIYENTERFEVIVTFNNPIAGDVIASSSATGNIIDDDAPFISIIAPANLVVVEGSDLSYDVLLQNASGDVITSLDREIGFSWNIATISEADATDTTRIARTVDFNTPSQIVRTKDINGLALTAISAVADKVYENDEAFRIAIGDLSGGLSFLTGSILRFSTDSSGVVTTFFIDAPVGNSHAGTIASSDEPEFEFTPTSLNENSGTANIRVSISNGVTISPSLREGRNIDFTWDTIAGSDASSATAGDDFIAVRNQAGSIDGPIGNIPPKTSTTIEITIVDDNFIDIDETFDISATFTLLDGNTKTQTQTITISDDDGDVIVDRDGNGLINITSLAMLRNVRNNLAGTSYIDGFGNILFNGCPSDVCSGYELDTSLDFDLAGDGVYTVTNDANAGDASVYTLDPADYTLKGWQPIGSAAGAAFTATFDGNGYTISGLAMRRFEEVNLGMFGSIDGANIRNLHLKGALVVATFTAAANAVENVGILAGRAINSKIYASSASGTITESVSSGKIAPNLFGGLIGIIDGGSVTASYSAGKIIIQDFGGAVGGLIGGNDDNDVVITASYSVTNIDLKGSGRVIIGGLIGTNFVDLGPAASYTTSSLNIEVGGIDGDYGRLIGIEVNAGGGINHLDGDTRNLKSYGFGNIASEDALVTGGFTRVNDGSFPVSHPTEISADLLVWNDATSNTLGAWDFRTNYNPTLKYSDYNGVEAGFECAPRCDEFLPGQTFPDMLPFLRGDASTDSGVINLFWNKVRGENLTYTLFLDGGPQGSSIPNSHTITGFPDGDYEFYLRVCSGSDCENTPTITITAP